MYKLAVVGNPIDHSLSPRIFELFAKQFRLDLRYDKILAHDGADLKIKVDGFFNSGGLALNITSPFKYLAYSNAAQYSMRANFCKASNFLTYRDKKIFADTTDGIGLITDIEKNKERQLNGTKVLILGSGFVLDSILLDFIVANPERIDLLARNSDRLDYLNAKFMVGRFNPKVKYDVIINSTPNVETNQLFSQIKNIADNALCYDLSYKSNKIFLNHMKNINQTVEAVDGLGMLVEQAKVAFIRLFNKVPDSESVIANLLNPKKRS